MRRRTYGSGNIYFKINSSTILYNNSGNAYANSSKFVISKEYTAIQSEHILAIAYASGTNSQQISLTVNGVSVAATDITGCMGIWDLHLNTGDVIKVSSSAQNSSQLCSAGCALIKY